MLLSILLITPTAFAETLPDHVPIQLCAQTADGKIRLMLDTERQTVRYAGKNQSIPIVFHSEKIRDTVSGRASGLEYRWLERYRGKTTGEYRYRLMGANFYQFRYINYRNKQTVDFANIDTANPETASCSF